MLIHFVTDTFIGRMFDFHLLDMIEFGLDSFRSLSDIKGAKVTMGIKPCIIFSGELWNQNEEYGRCKSLLLDFFRGEQVEQVVLGGFEHAMTFTAADGKIFMRSYKYNISHLERNLMWSTLIFTALLF